MEKGKNEETKFDDYLHSVLNSYYLFIYLFIVDAKKTENGMKKVFYLQKCLSK